jgi:hypothetical protein
MLIPFIGPAFDFGFGGSQTWDWTAARFWLEVLPGIACFVGGLMMLVSANRGTAMLGAWLAIAAGAWFVIGPTLAKPFHLGDLGTAMGGTTRVALTWLLFFYALGAAILYLSSTGQGRLSVRSLRDIENAQMYAQRKLMARGGRGGFGLGRGREREFEPAGAAGAERERVGSRRGERVDRTADDVYPSDTRRTDRSTRAERGDTARHEAYPPTAVRADQAEPVDHVDRARTPSSTSERAGYPDDTARADAARGRHEGQHEGLGEKIGRTLARHGIGGRH